MSFFIRSFLLFFLSVFYLLPLQVTVSAQDGQELPNILWITSEDNSPLLGCYGDQLATTPYLDQLAGEGSVYDYMRSEECPFNLLLEAAQSATLPGRGDMEAYLGYLDHTRPAVRYLGVTGFLIRLEQALPFVPALQKASEDLSSSVAILAAETLYQLGHKEDATAAYQRILTSGVYGMLDRNFALNSIDAAGIFDPGLRRTSDQLYHAQKDSLKGFERFNATDFLMSEYLLKNWESGG